MICRSQSFYWKTEVNMDFWRYSMNNAVMMISVVVEGSLLAF